MKIIFEFKTHNTEPIWRILSIANVPIPTLGVHQILDDALLLLLLLLLNFENNKNRLVEIFLFSTSFYFPSYLPTLFF
jgi:hypothetical protein